MVELHGGTIAATSTEGVGSTFTVTLPLSRRHLQPDQVSTSRTAPVAVTSPAAPDFLAEASQLAESGGAEPFLSEAWGWLHDTSEATGTHTGIAAAPASDEAARVLVVDDNPDMRDYLARLLTQQYRVRSPRTASPLSRLRWPTRPTWSSPTSCCPA